MKVYKISVTYGPDSYSLEEKIEGIYSDKKQAIKEYIKLEKICKKEVEEYEAEHADEYEEDEFDEYEDGDYAPIYISKAGISEFTIDEPYTYRNISYEVDRMLDEVENIKAKLAETKTVVTHFGDDLDNKSATYALEKWAKEQGILKEDENLQVDRVPAGKVKEGMLNVDTGGHRGSRQEDDGTLVIDGNPAEGIKSASEAINNLGIYDLAGLQTFPLSKLQEVFGINADILYEHAFGRDDTTFLDIRNYQTKSNSLSLSQVVFRDYNYLEARDIIKEMVMSLTLTLIQNRLITKSISLSIVYTKNTFKSFHKQKQIYATNNYQNILTNFLYLYDNFVLKEGYIRQIGISFNQINKEAFKEYNLFTDQKQEEIDYRLFKTINDIKNRYGRNSLLQGINLLEHSTQKIRNTLIGGHHE